MSSGRNGTPSAKEEQMAVKIVNQLRSMQSPTLHYLLVKYQECPIIKADPQLQQILFGSHLELVAEMIQWMLIPKQIARRKKVRSNLDFFPYKSKEFLKDNNSFYERLYIYASNGQLPLSQWFCFLRKQHYDHETIHTALGYFTEVMLPFAKFDFLGSLLVSHQLSNLALGHSQSASTPSIMKILPEELIAELIQFCHLEPILSFLKASVLASIEDPTDYKKCRTAMLKILENCQQKGLVQKFEAHSLETNHAITHKVDFLQNVSQALAETLANIQPCKQLPLQVQYFIDLMLESKVIHYVVEQIQSSRFCSAMNSPPKMRPLGKSVIITDLSSSHHQSVSPVLKSSVSFHSHKSLSSPSDHMTFSNPDQQDLIECLVRILSSCVEIFNRIPKTLQVSDSEQRNSEGCVQENRFTAYSAVVQEYGRQIEYVLESLSEILKIAHNHEADNNARSIPFSSGQKIKCVSLMRFEVIKLLLNCLTMVENVKNTKLMANRLNHPQKQSSEFKKFKKIKLIPLKPFKVNIHDYNAIRIIQKYLTENKWNNLVHHTVEKMCHILIASSQELVANENWKVKNLQPIQDFLAFLIENFTQKDYIFLDTFKFTHQGNLQSLYNISKDIAYILNQKGQLDIVLSKFEPWRKFILENLKQYEEKTYPVSTQPESGLDQRPDNAEVECIKIDEVDSIRKLIKNIATSKWSGRVPTSRGASKSVILEPNSKRAVEEGNEEQPFCFNTYGEGSSFKNGFLSQLKIQKKELHPQQQPESTQQVPNASLSQKEQSLLRVFDKYANPKPTEEH